jgi:hypothetical protein
MIFTLPVVLPAGKHVITAHCLGNDNCLPENSNAVSVTVQ